MRTKLNAWEAELVSVHERLGGLFRRSEPRQRSLAYLQGLLGSIERKNVGLEGNVGDNADFLCNLHH